MGRPQGFLERTQLVKVLITLLDHAMPGCAHVEYRLVGTGAALLHGVRLPAVDIDILVRKREGVDAFCLALSGLRCIDPPAWLEGAQQYYGNYEVEGVEVEFSTVEVDSPVDTIETFGLGPWKHSVPLPCGRYTVPTVRLELRLITELYRNRPDRYKPLLEHLRVTGCDTALIRRGMTAVGLPEALRDEVLCSLSQGQATHP